MRSLFLARTFLSTMAVVLPLTTLAHAETTVTFTSKYEGTVKVCVYKASDVVQAIPLATWKIDPNKSVSWNKAPKTFHVKVFEPQFIDKLLASKNQVAYSTNVTLQKDNSISVTAKKSLRLRNDSGKKLKFAAYKASDKVMAIPLKTWTISSGKSITWADAPSTFNLKLFEPGLIDKKVYSKTSVPDRKTVKVTRKSNKYKVTIN
jgi:hypothetical protein